MTTPEPAPRHLHLITTHPTTGTDAVLVHRARTSAQYLEGLIAAGMLERAGQPQHLPALLFPDTHPDTVQDIWNTAFAVGYWAGRNAGRPAWDTASLDRLRTALHDAGYTGMGRLVERTAYAAPSRPAPTPHTGPAAANTPTTPRP